MVRPPMLNLPDGLPLLKYGDPDASLSFGGMGTKAEPGCAVGGIEGVTGGVAAGVTPGVARRGCLGLGTGLVCAVVARARAASSRACFNSASRLAASACSFFNCAC